MKLSVLPIGMMWGCLQLHPDNADKWSDKFPHIKNTGDIPGECSFEAMSKKDYSSGKANH